MGVSLINLASGSRGNSTVIRSSRTALLVDCGLSCRQLCLRLEECRIAPDSLDAILITHEHSDHVGGLHVMAKKFRVPVYMTAPTHEAWRRIFRDSAGNPVAAERLETIVPGRGFTIGDIAVQPFTIPHDAADPSGYTFTAEGIKVGVATDLGYLPPNVKDCLTGCQLLYIESNHDLEMLRTGSYPWAVKQRVMSRVGHLSNAALAEFLANDYDGAAACIVLAHLSEQNNHPELARRAAEEALAARNGLFAGAATPELMLASQTKILKTVTL
jgi:phosphoribosyl 1,2-cyclic phosphodiesterase